MNTITTTTTTTTTTNSADTLEVAWVAYCAAVRQAEEAEADYDTAVENSEDARVKVRAKAATLETADKAVDKAEAAYREAIAAACRILIL